MWNVCSQHVTEVMMQPPVDPGAFANVSDMTWTWSKIKKPMPGFCTVKHAGRKQCKLKSFNVRLKKVAKLNLKVYKPAPYSSCAR